MEPTRDIPVTQDVTQEETRHEAHGGPQPPLGDRRRPRADGAHGADREHGAHDTRGTQGGPASTWRMAAAATLHCLTGCAIGEVLGMVLGTWWGWGTWPTVGLAVVLAFFFGYLLTVTSVLRAGLSFGAAVKVALAADTVSILVMEVVDNAVMVYVPGAMDAGLGNGLFWASLVFALAVAFVVTLPVNRWMISRGLGHAVVHEHH
jgi:hypothetical protein